MQTIRLLYLSEHRAPIAYADLAAIVEKSVTYNKLNDITGVLLWTEGTFLQEIEGERGAVSQLYLKIALDVRHTHVELLQVREIESRSFPNWSMKLVGVDGARRTDVHERLKLEPLAKMTGARAHELLLTLATPTRASA